jgi:4-hydroxy-3-methylbut-2-en-1-yl diphosphate reductase
VFQIKNSTVIFRTHGIIKDNEEYIRKTELRIIDTACSFIKRVSEHAMYLKKMGYTMVIVGDKNHPEIKSVLSYLDNDGIVLQEPAGIDEKKWEL